MEESRSEAGRIPTNLRLIMILEALAEADEPLTPTQINRKVGLPKQSIHRLCATLVEEKLLVRDVSGKRLRPSARALDMARGLLRSRQTTEARRQILLRLAEVTGETVNFVVPDERGMTYIDRVETDWAFRIELPVGSHVPFHCTASGKCYLAALPAKQRHRLLSVLTLDQRTDNSITDLQALERELTLIEEQGYAIDNEELFDGMIALAVPVRDRHGYYLASIAFHGPTQRLDRAILMSHLQTLKDAALALASVSG